MGFSPNNHVEKSFLGYLQYFTESQAEEKKEEK